MNEDKIIEYIRYFSELYGVDDPEIDDNRHPDLGKYTVQEREAYRYGFRSCARLILWELKYGQQ